MPRREGERKQTLEKRVFGVKLDPRATEVPEHLELWLNILETDLKVEGLFRVNGANLTINAIRNAIEKGESVNYMLYTPHDITGVIKMYFRELPTPLIPVELYDCFIAASLTKNDSDCCNVEKLQKAVRLLPPGHKTVLYRMAKFFNALSQFSDENKMGVENLSTVFAPNLFRHPLEATNIELVVADFPLQIKLIYTIILHYTTVFKGFSPSIIASEETLEKVSNFKKLIEKQYSSYGNLAMANEFTTKMKSRYAEYRAVTLKQHSAPEVSPRVISERYERIKTGKMTYEETKKLLEVLLRHWQANLNNGSGSSH